MLKLVVPQTEENSEVRKPSTFASAYNISSQAQTKRTVSREKASKSSPPRVAGGCRESVFACTKLLRQLCEKFDLSKQYLKLLFLS